MALLDKVPDGKGVFEDITRGETLVGHVKEGEMFLLLEQVGKLFPLCLGGVDAGGVLRISGSAADALSIQKATVGWMVKIVFSWERRGGDSHAHTHEEE